MRSGQIVFIMLMILLILNAMIIGALFMKQPSNQTRDQWQNQN